MHLLIWYGNISLWLYLPKYFKGVKVKNISLTRQIKFRKLEKLPGDSDSGDVVLND